MSQLLTSARPVAMFLGRPQVDTRVVVTALLLFAGGAVYLNQTVQTGS